MKIIKPIISILFPLVAGGLSGFLTAGEINTWYTTLERPSFSPPNFVFGPVWTILYLVMGISLYRIWTQQASEDRTRSLMLFNIQLVLNFFWSLIFFRWHQIGIALLEIVVLWTTIILMIRAFRKVDKWAAYMNMPYLIWVSFATALNAEFFRLNG